MTTTKKIYKIKKNSIKNLKTKKISLKSSSVLQKRKNKHNSLKKNKVINGGAKKLYDDIKIGSNTLKCPYISSYVSNLNTAFLTSENIKYRKKIKKIACQFINYKNKLIPNNSESFHNKFNEVNFLVFMCYFFDDTEVAYINHKQCKPNTEYYNREEIKYVLTEKCPQLKNTSKTNNNIYDIINNNNITNNVNKTWVEFLHTKLTREHTEDTSPIIKIILETLKTYIVTKIQKEKILIQQTKEPLRKLLIRVLGDQNIAIDFLSTFDSARHITRLIKPNLGDSEIYQDPSEFKSPMLNQMDINQKNSTV